MINNLTESPTIIFDRDGTLLDFSNMFLNFILALHESEQLTPPTAEFILSLEYWKAIISKELYIGAIRVRDRIDTIPINYMHYGQLYPGVNASLKKIRTTGVKMAIVSGWVGTDATYNFMAQEGLSSCFDFILTCDDLNRDRESEHHSSGYLSAKKLLLDMAIRKLETEPSRTIVVGDSPEDIEAGKVLNTTTVAVLTGNGQKQRESIEALNPDRIINSVAELPELLNAANH
ncbi:MAG: HAD family hydrolase [Chloroflexaceae bacterium]|nr:HAD family hydrolase [Chloroflexaceae bacterium]